MEVVVTRDENGELYLIADHMVPNVQRIAPGKLEHCMMFSVQNKDGELFMWLVPLPVPDDHPAYLAMNDWICIRGMH